MISSLKDNIISTFSERFNKDLIGAQAIGFLGVYSLVILKVFSDANPLAAAAAGATAATVLVLAKKFFDKLYLKLNGCNSDYDSDDDSEEVDRSDDDSKEVGRFDDNIVLSTVGRVVKGTSALVAGLAVYASLDALSTDKLIAINLAILGIAITSGIINYRRVSQESYRIYDEA